jgi:hypothetical protein
MIGPADLLHMYGVKINSRFSCPYFDSLLKVSRKCCTLCVLRRFVFEIYVTARYQMKGYGSD